MTIDDLINGVHYEIQGPVEVRRVSDWELPPTKLFSSEYGLGGLPEEVAEQEIAYIYSEPFGYDGATAIIIETE